MSAESSPFSTCRQRHGWRQLRIRHLNPNKQGSGRQVAGRKKTDQKTRKSLNCGWKDALRLWQQVSLGCLIVSRCTHERKRPDQTSQPHTAVTYTHTQQAGDRGERETQRHNRKTADLHTLSHCKFSV